ncbi:MAG: DUF4405 domain-containing protein [Alistipes sp.]|nr:DUF4405 domain-containing protein [Alistipes sp.]
MTKSKFIYLNDLLLVPLFVLTVWTGIELHVAGHGSDHAVWHHWALFHTVVGLLFMAAGAIHVKSHWGWYKGLKTLKRRDKRKMVLLFSVVFLLVVVSGLALLFFFDGANTLTGLLHYKIGLAVSLLGLLHILKRKRFLIRGFVLNLLGKNEKERN